MRIIFSDLKAPIHSYMMESRGYVYRHYKKTPQNIYTFPTTFEILLTFLYCKGLGLAYISYCYYRYKIKVSFKPTVSTLDTILVCWCCLSATVYFVIIVAMLVFDPTVCNIQFHFELYMYFDITIKYHGMVSVFLVKGLSSEKYNFSSLHQIYRR